MAYDSTKPADDEYLSAFPAEMREQLRAIVEDALVNALKVRGYSPGNLAGNIPLNNGTLNANLNADQLDGHDASYFSADGHVHTAATPSSNGFMANTDKAKLDGVATGAEVNQNAFSNVLVGKETIQADNKTDTLTFEAGANIAITPDATNDKVTIAVTGTVPKATADKNGNDITTTYAPSGFGLGTYNTAAIDPNTIDKTGFYYCTGTNLPEGMSDANVIHIAYSTQYSTQTCHEYGPEYNGKMWVRGKNAGTWSAWSEIPIVSNGVCAFKGNTNLLFGPNGTWGEYLRVGGNGNEGITTASIATSNGNLHIDAKAASYTFLNWYTGKGVIFGNGDATNQIAKIDSEGVTCSRFNGCAATLGRGGNTTTPMNFDWAGQGGQPDWLWGSNDGTNIKVWKPANFDVNSSQLLRPLSGPADYKLAYTADGSRNNAGEWGRVVMRYEPNGQTYGVRVDRADYADSAGSANSINGYSADSITRRIAGRNTPVMTAIVDWAAMASACGVSTIKNLNNAGTGISAYGGDYGGSGFYHGDIILTQSYQNFDAILVVFSDDNATYVSTAKWEKWELDFAFTRGLYFTLFKNTSLYWSVYPMGNYGTTNHNLSTTTRWYCQGQNSSIIEIYGLTY